MKKHCIVTFSVVGDPGSVESCVEEMICNLNFMDVGCLSFAIEFPSGSEVVEDCD